MTPNKDCVAVRVLQRRKERLPVGVAKANVMFKRRVLEKHERDHGRVRRFKDAELNVLIFAKIIIRRHRRPDCTHGPYSKKGRKRLFTLIVWPVILLFI